MAKHDYRVESEGLVPLHTNTEDPSERHALEYFDHDYRAEGTGSVPII
jgi:hypothetical protein